MTRTKVEDAIELIRQFLERDDVRIEISYDGDQVQSCKFSKGLEQKKEEVEIKMQISNLLKHLSIPQHVNGWGYLNEGLIMIWNNPDLLKFITKRLYPEIAKKFKNPKLGEKGQITSSKVERAIRNAIEVAWSRGGMKEQEEIFKNAISKLKGRPTNGEFMAVCYHYLKEKNS